MGIDSHVAKFLKYSSLKKKFNLTITIGRQEIKDTEDNLKLILNDKNYKKNKYCEDLFKKYFGSTKIESIDNNDFEGATYTHDMNKTLSEGSLIKKYDTVIDGGCLEHIYNIPKALENCSLLAKPGGQIIHILPANNFCGHGFYQLSPELFFSLYKNKNGYSETTIYLADLCDNNYWYRVNKPERGRRNNIKSSNSLYILVRTILQKNYFNHSDIQQSDYEHQWSKINKNEPGEIKTYFNLKKKIKNYPSLFKILKLFYKIFIMPLTSFVLRRKYIYGLNEKNSDLIKYKIKNLIS